MVLFALHGGIGSTDCVQNSTRIRLPVRVIFSFYLSLHARLHLDQFSYAPAGEQLKISRLDMLVGTLVTKCSNSLSSERIEFRRIDRGYVPGMFFPEFVFGDWSERQGLPADQVRYSTIHCSEHHLVNSVELEAGSFGNDIGKPHFLRSGHQSSRTRHAPSRFISGASAMDPPSAG